MAAKRAVGSRAVEVIPRPVWNSFGVEHLRRFLDAERQYRAQLAATGGVAPTLFELVDSDFLPAIPLWVAGRTKVALKSARELTNPADLVQWDNAVRAAIENYLADTGLIDSLSLEDCEARLRSAVYWPAELPTYLESGTQFAALYAIAVDRLRLDRCYLTSDKNKRRCVHVLVSLLQPAEWRAEIERAVLRRNITDPQALLTHLGSRDSVLVLGSVLFCDVEFTVSVSLSTQGFSPAGFRPCSRCCVQLSWCDYLHCVVYCDLSAFSYTHPPLPTSLHVRIPAYTLT